MSDTILRRAHMGAIREISDLKQTIMRLETGLLVASCMNQYLAARMQLHGKPRKMDVGILRLSQLAMDAKTPEDMELAVQALRSMMEVASKFSKEAIEEVSHDPNFRTADDATADDIVRRVLNIIDEKLEAYQSKIREEAGFTKEDLEALVDEINRRFGGAEDSE